MEKPQQIETISLDDIASLEKDLNISEKQNASTKIKVVEESDSDEDVPAVPVPAVPVPAAPVPAAPVTPPKASPQARKDDIKTRLKKKLEAKKTKLDMTELLKLKKQLDALHVQA